MGIHEQSVRRYCETHHIPIDDVLVEIHENAQRMIVNPSGKGTEFEDACALWMSMMPELNDQEPQEFAVSSEIPVTIYGAVVTDKNFQYSLNAYIQAVIDDDGPEKEDALGYIGDAIQTAVKAYLKQRAEEGE